jgi:putative flippase GtrA
MTSIPDKIVSAAWRLIPEPLERKLRSETGQRFVRFVLVAAAGVVTSQIVLGILTGPVYLSAGISGVIASMTAALVSYVLSRWAWERTGKPDLLRETVPFWLISMSVWAILGLTSHFASVWAHSEGYTHLKRHLVVQGAYFLMNCLTFFARFLLFHYVLFADKSAASGRLAEASPGATGPGATGRSAIGRSGSGRHGRHAATSSSASAGREAGPGEERITAAESAHGSDTGPMALVSGDSGPPRS